MRIFSACSLKSIVRNLIEFYQHRLACFKFIPKYRTFIGACFLLLGILFSGIFTINSTYASGNWQFPTSTEGQINEALQKTVPIRLLPSHPLYFLISVKENINRFLKASSAKKAEFDIVLSGKRLKEVYLLLEKNGLKNVSRGLVRYKKRSDKMVSQLEKARSQNQDVVALSGKMVEDLRSHEILLFAINKKGLNLGKEFDEAVSSFINMVGAIDIIQPGFKDRFKTVSSSKSLNQQVPSPNPTASPMPFESSPSVKPRRIIY